MPKAQLNLIGLIVEDMARSLAFYREMGLDIPEGVESEGHVEITLEGGIRLAWDTHDVIQRSDTEWQAPQGHHQIGLAFLCDSPQAVDALHQSLTAKGYTNHNVPFDAYWGQRYAQIVDPDGNVVDLFAPLSGSD